MSVRASRNHFYQHVDISESYFGPLLQLVCKSLHFAAGSRKRRELLGVTYTCHVSWFIVTSSVGTNHKEIYRYKEDIKYVKSMSGHIKRRIWKGITEC